MSRDSGAVENPNAGFDSPAPGIDPADPFGVVNGVATRWVTKDKRNLLIAEMSDAHLQNTVRFLEGKLEAARNAMADAFGFAGSCSGEMASYYADHEADYASDRSVALELGCRPVLAGLRAELKRRGLPELAP